MSRLNELIEQYCPNGVEYKKISDIALKYTDGMHNLPKDITSNGKFPILSAQNIFNGKIEINTQKYVNEDIFNRENKRTNVAKGDILLTIVGAIGRVAIVDSELKALFQRSVCVIKPNYNIINSKYLQYILESSPVQSYIINNAHGAAQKGLYLKEVGKIKIPVPPLPVQEEIVRILDKFTALATELKTELALRKKQYEYYKENIFEKYVSNTTIFESLNIVADVRDGTHDSPKPSTYGKYLITSKNIKNGTINFEDSYLISEQDFNSINVRSKVDKWDLLFTMIGTVGEVGLVVDEPNYAIKNVGLIKTGNELLSRFLYFYLTTKRVKKYVENNRSKGSQSFLSLGKLRDLPVPKLSESDMKQIIKIIRKFDTLCNDLAAGLPAEIEKRQKQYEYYRDKLLAFEPAPPRPDSPDSPGRTISPAPKKE